MKWIKQAVVAAKREGSGDMAASEELHKGREALQEFMTCVGNKKEGVREVSALMVCCVEDGIRVGLKDDDAGGWCWRFAKTFPEALDALEEAIRSPGAFRGAQRKRQKGR